MNGHYSDTKDAFLKAPLKCFRLVIHNTVQYTKYSVHLKVTSKKGHTFAVVIGVLLLFIIRPKNLFRFLGFLG